LELIALPPNKEARHLVDLLSVNLSRSKLKEIKEENTILLLIIDPADIFLTIPGGVGEEDGTDGVLQLLGFPIGILGFGTIPGDTEILEESIFIMTEEETQ
jgi:hypothetical protein